MTFILGIKTMARLEDTRLVTADEFFKQGSGFVTLCGSTKFFTECMEANRQLTFNGWIVLMCGSWGHSYHKDVENTNTDYAKVKKLHYHKILESQAVVVVYDKSSYMGDSTRAEIDFAFRRDIPIFYFDGKEFTGHTLSTKIPYELDDTSLIDEYAKIYSLGF
jgi:hypothetical protein